MCSSDCQSPRIIVTFRCFSSACQDIRAPVVCPVHGIPLKLPLCALLSQLCDLAQHIAEFGSQEHVPIHKTEGFSLPVHAIDVVECVWTEREGQKSQNGSDSAHTALSVSLDLVFGYRCGACPNVLDEFVSMIWGYPLPCIFFTQHFFPFLLLCSEGRVFRYADEERCVLFYFLCALAMSMPSEMEKRVTHTPRQRMVAPACWCPPEWLMKGSLLCILSIRSQSESLLFCRMRISTCTKITSPIEEAALPIGHPDFAWEQCRLPVSPLVTTLLFADEAFSLKSNVHAFRHVCAPNSPSFSSCVKSTYKKTVSAAEAHTKRALQQIKMMSTVKWLLFFACSLLSNTQFS